MNSWKRRLAELLFAEVLCLFSFCSLSRGADGQTLLDLDFTKPFAPPAGVTIQGGKWDKGWLVTGDLDRIFIDLGRDIRSGYVEVTISRGPAPVFEKRKRNWLGLSASPSMNQAPGGYARAGADGYGFSKAEIFSAVQPNTICEKKFGEAADWPTNGVTPILVRATIQDNVMTWTHNKGEPATCGGAEQPVTHFRYVAAGGILDQTNGWHHGALIGLKILRLRIVAQP
jgi:hypothetical protein